MKSVHCVATAPRLIRGAVLAAGLAFAASAAFSQTWPARPIRMIVPFAAGGPTDVYARIIGQRLAEELGQPVVIEDKPGATGLIGTAAVRDAAPDGYTLLFTSNSAHVIGPLLHKPAPFDPVADFAPVMMVLRYPMYLLTSAKLPVTNVKEFVALAKSKPGQMSYSSVGIGSGGHLACELFNIATGIDTVHVAFKGAAPAQQALAGGQVDYMCDSVGFSQPLVDAGKLRGLAIIGPNRLAAVPDVPTVAEQGIPGVAAYIWQGIYGPKALPPAIRDRLNTTLTRIVNEPAFKDRVAKAGYELLASSPELMTRETVAEKAMWSRIITEKNIKAE
ncbi:MAG: tripartite tricarboxylate transporter substrate binding protein [Ramlibacter sp.]|jgi:tripartite-type tricarboxylate transporter receptor subunit TctC|nr:tripartite tricarboxylate transporter substrate binding protein [Ramlibacter sp.]